jgi:hypothetical protein
MGLFGFSTRKKARRKPATFMRGRTLKRRYYKSKSEDKHLKALHPGKRKARKSKKTYYERRVNRSDMSRKTRL